MSERETMEYHAAVVGAACIRGASLARGAAYFVWSERPAGAGLTTRPQVDLLPQITPIS